MPLSLSQRLADLVERPTRQRGLDYFRAGRVELLDASDREVRAVVRGTRRYRVSLERRGDELAVLCSCPYFAREAWACKHVWAALLSAESEGYLNGAAGAKPIETMTVSPDFDDLDDLPDGEGDLLEDETLPARSGRPSSAPKPAGRSVGEKPRPKPARRSWEALISSVSSPSGSPSRAPLDPWPSDKEILYVLDVERTIAAQKLALEVAAHRRKKNGEWSKLAPARIPVAQIAELPEPADRELLSLLRGAGGAGYGWYPSYEYGQLEPSFSLPSTFAEIVLPRLCATGRCRLREKAPAASVPSRVPYAPRPDQPLLPLAWDDGAPWELRIEVRRDDARGRYVVAGSLARDGDRMSLSEPSLLVAGGFVFARGSAARLEDFGAFRWVGLLREHPEIEAPIGEGSALVETLLRSTTLPLDLPPELRFEEVRGAPRPSLSIRRPKGMRRTEEHLEADLTFEYDGAVVSEREPGNALLDVERRRRILRDPASERRASERLVSLGFRYFGPWYDRSSRHLAPRQLPRAVRTLLAEGWRVEAEGKLYRQPGPVHASVVSGIDWFELQATVDYGGAVANLPELLAALRRGETMVPLGDGSFGLLPEEWLRKYGLVASLGTAEEGALRFRRSQAAFLDALLAAEPEIACDDVFVAAREEARRFEGIEPADPPPSFRGELRPYQREGLGWIGFLERFGLGGCLADDMGLGKTVQVLALLEARRDRRSRGEASGPRPSLVVAPRSLVFNWKAEATRFAPELCVLDHTGRERSRDPACFDDYDLVLTTYGTLRRDAAHIGGARFRWVILDEAQAIKNAASDSAKAAKLLRADHRLALSGTPVENHLGELWSLFDFLNPGMLGSATVFRTLAGGGASDGEARSLLARALRPVLLRRTKGQVAKDLPERTEQTIFTELDRAQRRLYDELRTHYRRSLETRIERDGFARAKIMVLEALLRLRQAACHPGLIDRARAGEPCAKLEALLPTLEEVVAEGHKALVFSQFTSFLAIVRERLDGVGLRYEYLDGRTRDRAARVVRFQEDGGRPIFLASLKAGGLGLNLTAAEYVFLLDPWWNPAVEAQAIDRSHRIGQTRHVFAYRVIVRDTVEEKVLELQRRKRELADAILGGESGFVGALTREDLELLLS